MTEVMPVLKIRYYRFTSRDVLTVLLLVEDDQ